DAQSKRPLRMERGPYREPNLEEVQRVRARPRWVIFAVDVSGSMDGVKLREAKRTLITNAETLLATGGGDCRIGIVSFDSSARVVCQPTSNLAAVKRAVGE